MGRKAVQNCFSGGGHTTAMASMSVIFMVLLGINGRVESASLRGPSLHSQPVQPEQAQVVGSFAILG